MSKEDIIREAEALPIDERLVVIDSLLRSLNPPDSETDPQWIDLSRKRLSGLRSGDVSSIPGEEVLSKLEKRFPA